MDRDFFTSYIIRKRERIFSMKYGEKKICEFSLKKVYEKHFRMQPSLPTILSYQWEMKKKFSLLFLEIMGQTWCLSHSNIDFPNKIEILIFQ